MAADKIDARVVGGAFVAFLALLFVGMAVPRGPFVLVAGWPGTPPARLMQIVADADAEFVAGTGADWLAVVHSDDPGLATRLMAHGAMIVLDHALAAGCTEGMK